jgi:hypothetical protein
MTLLYDVWPYLASTYRREQLGGHRVVNSYMRSEGEALPKRAGTSEWLQ